MCIYLFLQHSYVLILFSPNLLTVQEAYVMQRITELQREGLWSEKRLPKVQEPPRVKAHWDYLIEEMIWLAADFAQERKWKKAAAKKVFLYLYSCQCNSLMQGPA